MLLTHKHLTLLRPLGEREAASPLVSMQLVKQLSNGFGFLANLDKT